MKDYLASEVLCGQRSSFERRPRIKTKANSSYFLGALSMYDLFPGVRFFGF